MLAKLLSITILIIACSTRAAPNLTCEQAVSPFRNYHCSTKIDYVPKASTDDNYQQFLFIDEQTEKQFLIKVRTHNSKKSVEDVEAYKKVSGKGGIIEMIEAKVDDKFVSMLFKADGLHILSDYVHYSQILDSSIIRRAKFFNQLVNAIIFVESDDVYGIKLSTDNIFVDKDLKPVLGNILYTDDKNKDEFNVVNSASNSKNIEQDLIWDLGRIFYFITLKKHIKFADKVTDEGSLEVSDNIITLREGMAASLAYIVDICLKRDKSERATLDDLAEVSLQIAATKKLGHGIVESIDIDKKTVPHPFASGFNLRYVFCVLLIMVVICAFLVFCSMRSRKIDIPPSQVNEIRFSMDAS